MLLRKVHFFRLLSGRFQVNYTRGNPAFLLFGVSKVFFTIFVSGRKMSYASGGYAGGNLRRAFVRTE